MGRAHKREAGVVPLHACYQLIRSTPMINSGRNIVLMLVGVVMVTIGCEAKPLSWAEVLEQNPDPKVVTDAEQASTK